MRHANISVFIPHVGCPYACAFCRQNTISDTERAPTPKEVDVQLKAAFDRIPEADRANTEIAFFGGSFTAIPVHYMDALLYVAGKYLQKDCHSGFSGIRISTRPDCISDSILIKLKNSGVTAIELGAQSMDDEVLSANKRGHTSADVVRSTALIKSYGFETGLQMMTGLYKSTPEKDIKTGMDIAALAPDTVRIYPTVIIKGTELARLYEQGIYVPYPFDDCIDVCAKLMGIFGDRNIRVIRLGLHAERSLEENAVGGFFHPALGELVRSRMIRDIIENAGTPAVCKAPSRLMSALVGHKGCNREYFAGRGVVFERDDTLSADTININGKDFRIG